MRHRWFILVAVLLLVLVGGAVAAYAYDSSRDDLIAKGVTVAGVDVGGMTDVRGHPGRSQRELAEAARAAGHRQARRRPRFTPLRAGRRRAGPTWAAWSTRRSRRAATARSSRRVARDITGGEENAQVPARVTLLDATRSTSSSTA